MGIIKKITQAAKNRTTYRVGLLQAKAYRVLKQHTTKVLEGFEISSMHWALLGLLNDNKEGIRSGDAADELGVEAPFVTQLFRELDDKNLVETKIDSQDSRAKLLCLNPKGKTFVTETEVHIRSKMKSLLKGISLSDLASYIVVLEKIIENSNIK